MDLNCNVVSVEKVVSVYMFLQSTTILNYSQNIQLFLLSH